MYWEMYPYDKDIQLWEPHGIKELVFSNKVREETGSKEYNRKVEWLSENDFFLFFQKKKKVNEKQGQRALWEVWQKF